MKALKILAFISVLSLMAVSQSKATGLILDQSVPDFTGSYMGVTYHTSNSLFSATGYTTAYTDPQNNLLTVAAYDYDYILTAYITSAGVLTNGTITISGDPYFGAGPFGYDTNLLTGNLITGTDGIAFGSGDGGNQVFQFRFSVSGGDADMVSDFGGIGAAGGIIFSAEFGGGDNPFTGLWTSGFNNNNTQNGVMDVFAVPEPSPALLMLAGGLLFAVMHRCRRDTFVAGRK